MVEEVIPDYYKANYKTDGIAGLTQTKDDLLKEISSFIDEMGERPQGVLGMRILYKIGAKPTEN